MNPATIQLIIQLIVLAEEELPSAILLVRKLKTAVATDPAISPQLNKDTQTVTADARKIIQQWQQEHLK